MVIFFQSTNSVNVNSISSNFIDANGTQFNSSSVSTSSNNTLNMASDGSFIFGFSSGVQYTIDVSSNSTSQFSVLINGNGGSGAVFSPIGNGTSDVNLANLTDPDWDAMPSNQKSIFQNNINIFLTQKAQYLQFVANSVSNNFLDKDSSGNLSISLPFCQIFLNNSYAVKEIMFYQNISTFDLVANFSTLIPFFKNLNGYGTNGQFIGNTYQSNNQNFIVIKDIQNYMCAIVVNGVLQYVFFIDQSTISKLNKTLYLLSFPNNGNIVYSQYTYNGSNSTPLSLVSSLSLQKSTTNNVVSYLPVTNTVASLSSLSFDSTSTSLSSVKIDGSQFNLSIVNSYWSTFQKILSFLFGNQSNFLSYLDNGTNAVDSFNTFCSLSEYRSVNNSFVNLPNINVTFNQNSVANVAFVSRNLDGFSFPVELAFDASGNITSNDSSLYGSLLTPMNIFIGGQSFTITTNRDLSFFVFQLNGILQYIVSYTGLSNQYFTFDFSNVTSSQTIGIFETKNGTTNSMFYTYDGTNLYLNFPTASAPVSISNFSYPQIAMNLNGSNFSINLFQYLLDSQNLLSSSFSQEQQAYLLRDNATRNAAVQLENYNSINYNIGSISLSSDTNTAYFYAIGKNFSISNNDLSKITFLNNQINTPVTINGNTFYYSSSTTTENVGSTILISDALSQNFLLLFANLDSSENITNVKIDSLAFKSDSNWFIISIRNGNIYQFNYKIDSSGVFAPSNIIYSAQLNLNGGNEIFQTIPSSTDFSTLIPFLYLASSNLAVKTAGMSTTDSLMKTLSSFS